jgi:hypothetical protein
MHFVNEAQKVCMLHGNAPRLLAKELKRGSAGAFDAKMAKSRKDPWEKACDIVATSAAFFA